MNSYPPPLHALNESSSFQIARAYKLGLLEDSGANPSGKGYESKSGLCSNDADCSDGQSCKNNSCSDVCSPNPCAGGYKCLTEGHSYSCVQCTADGDCTADKRCSNNICIDVCSGNDCASQGKKCTTNGAHGYVCYGCTSDAACASDQKCDTGASLCVPVCPSACAGDLICTVSGAHKAVCSCESDANCPDGYVCDTETKQCVAADCESWLTANGYGAAKDMETLTAALESDVTEVGLLESFTITEDIALQGKKLYQANKYSGSAECKALPKVTLSTTKSVDLENGGIYNTDIIVTPVQGGSVFSGDGTLQDVNMSLAKTDKNYTLFDFNWFNLDGNTLNIEGSSSIKIYSAANSHYYSAIYMKNKSILNISGTFKILGSNSLHILVDSSDFNVKKGASFIYKAKTHTHIFDASNRSTLTFDGQINAETDISTLSHPFTEMNHTCCGVFNIQNSSLALNANGNKLTGVYIFQTGSPDPATSSNMEINGSTAISVFNPSFSGYWMNRSSVFTNNYIRSKNNILITAPVTVNVMPVPRQTSPQYQEAAIIDLNTESSLSINSTVEATAGYAALGLTTLGSKAYINGIEKISYSKGLSYKTGAKIKVNGSCRQATSDGTYGGNDVKDSVTPPSFMSGICN